MATTKRVRNVKSSGTSVPRAERKGVPIEVYLSEDDATALDDARGDKPRATWVREAIQKALRRR